MTKRMCDTRQINGELIHKYVFKNWKEWFQVTIILIYNKLYVDSILRSGN